MLSHSLATISLQAGVGLHLIESDPSQAREALVSIRTASNEALAQTRAACWWSAVPATKRHGP